LALADRGHPATAYRLRSTGVRSTKHVVSSSNSNNLLWWVIPGVLAGMPMPFIHPARRLNGGGELGAFDDELSVLQAAGIYEPVTATVDGRSDRDNPHTRDR
jgi:hypothetical protein